MIGINFVSCFKFVSFFAFISFISAQTTNSNCGNNGTCHKLASCQKNPQTQQYSCVCNTWYGGDGVNYCYFLFGNATGAVPCNASSIINTKIRCTDGTCVSLSSKNNMINDCSNGEDENCYVVPNQPSNPSSTIRCDGKCLVIGSLSDINKCPKRGMNDTMYCTFYGHKVGVDAFMCASKTVCIPKSFVNDTFCSCPDCSDEPNITTTTSTTTTTTPVKLTAIVNNVVVNQFANTTTRTASQDDPESYSDYYDSDSSDDSQTTTTGSGTGDDEMVYNPYGEESSLTTTQASEGGDSGSDSGGGSGSGSGSGIELASPVGAGSGVHSGGSSSSSKSGSQALQCFSLNTIIFGILSMMALFKFHN